jgi:phosphoribosylformimino-5-aminoimidazole carboxamide ribotide isomerase
MIVFPAIDIKDGQCVRLFQGKKEEVTVYGEDPVAMAKQWESQGAKWLHVVDLDGAFTGEPQNQEAIIKIAQGISIPIEVGGGIRTEENARAYLEAGVQRVIFGTSAVTRPGLLKQLAAEFPGRIAVSIDAKDGLVCVEGWVKGSAINAVLFAEELFAMGIDTFVVTDIRRDGAMTGPNLDIMKEIQEKIPANLIVSGGVRSNADLDQAEKEGFYGAITGKALYEGAIDLSAYAEEGSC